jgi:hypothetical protein
MVSKRWLPVTLVVLVLATGCEGPFAYFPGGSLEGAPTPVPASWEFTGDIDTIQFETNPSEPYSVNIWVVGLGEHLYVHAGDNRSEWIANMEADPNVRLQADDAVYELAANRVTDQAEFDRFAAAYADKYYGRPGNENVTEAYLFRLSKR